jgi:hypothetical protein
VRHLERADGEWIHPSSRTGESIPFRYRVSKYDHAKHFLGMHYASGKVEEDWSGPWGDRDLHDMKEGVVYAITLEVIPDQAEAAAFRIHYQDAAGAPPPIEGGPADLAVLCVAGWWKSEGYPERVVESVAARHLMGIHYEDFFEPRGSKPRFVFGLTDGRASEFFRRGTSVLPPEEGRVAPAPCSCGPCARGWSMPVAGDWLVFHAAR